MSISILFTFSLSSATWITSRDYRNLSQGMLWNSSQKKCEKFTKAATADHNSYSSKMPIPRTLGKVWRAIVLDTAKFPLFLNPANIGDGASEV